MNNTTNNILFIFLLILIFYLMSVLSSILIPLVLAFLFASLFQPLIRFLKRIQLPQWLILPTIAIITLGIIFSMSLIIIQTISDIISQKDFLVEMLSKKAMAMALWAKDIAGTYFKIEINDQTISSIFSANFVSSLIGGFAQTISSFTSSFVMFALYYIVLLTGLSEYKPFLEYVGGKNGNTLMMHFEEVQKSIIKYISTKTLLNLITGTLAGLICWIFGLKFAFFWGFLTFLLFFLPTIGSIIAPIFPLIMAIIQFDSLQPVLFLLLSLAVIQAIIGNFIEPVIMGHSLRLNTLTVIFGLVFWGYLWGIAGMMLCVPLLVFFKLIFEQSPGLSYIARIMGVPEEKKN